ncbi:MAG: hypothetical protein QOD06_3233, partial [Candidatus Binatota bacterium]|nr:hypothetical protein [Candidatus Binatota bacterium]
MIADAATPLAGDPAPPAEKRPLERDRGIFRSPS